MATCETAVILGPPGTGKTSQLIRAAQEAFSGDEGSFAFVSHTRAAAKELADRCGMKKARVGTLHSLCFNLLGLTKQQVVDEAKLAEFGRRAGFDMATDGAELLALESLSTASGVEAGTVYARSLRPCPYRDFMYFVESYRAWKSANAFLDFNDMLVKTVMSRPPVEFERLYIDEAQDLSHLQWCAINTLARSVKSVTVAGDDDQAIFTWGGADAHGISRFMQRPGTQVTTLGISHRIPKTAHRLAQSVVGRIGKRIDKKYKPMQHKGRVERFGSFNMLDSELEGAVVLYRDVSAREYIDQHLSRLGISFTALSGAPAPYDSKWARAIRTIDKMKRGETASLPDYRGLLSVLTPRAKRAFDVEGVDGLRSGNPLSYMDPPPAIAAALATMDPLAPPRVRVSTIHNFKGAEADRIILCTGMSERVARQYAIDPDAEHRVFYVGATRTKDYMAIVSGPNEYTI